MALVTATIGSVSLSAPIPLASVVMSSSLRLPSYSQSDDYNEQRTVVEVRDVVATAPAVLVQHDGAKDVNITKGEVKFRNAFGDGWLA